MVSRSEILATLVLASCLAGCSDAVVDVQAPAVTFNRENRGDSWCIPRMSVDGMARENITAACDAPHGSVMWRLEEYSMIDRDQFKGDIYGVLIEDATAMNSTFTLRPHGGDFLLLESFKKPNFTIGCQTVLQEVNVNISPDSFTLYGPIPYIDDPAASVCRESEGTYTGSFMYQCPDISGQPNEGCVNESRVCYSLTLNDNTADCTPKRTWCRPSDERIIFTCTDIQNTAPLRTCLNAITDIPTTSMMNMVTDFEFYTLNFTADISASLFNGVLPCTPVVIDVDDDKDTPIWLLVVLGIVAVVVGVVIIILPVAVFLCIRKKKNPQTAPKVHKLKNVGEPTKPTGNEYYTAEEEKRAEAMETRQL